MADVTLVNSTFSQNASVPLGALYLTSYLEAHGYEVDFRDYQLCDDSDVGNPQQFAGWLPDSAPILASSTLSSSLPLVLATLSLPNVRDRFETVVLGGAGVSNIGPQILKQFPAIDIVAGGEGEETLLEIVQRIGDDSSLEDVLGITYRNGDGVHQNQPRPRIRDLAKIPFPAYERVTLEEYSCRSPVGHVPLGVLSTRGCPYGCTFCDVPGIWGACAVYRSVSDVLDEIELLKSKFSIPQVHIVDDTFVLNKHRVLEFCRRLKERKLDLRWSCFGRVDRMDSEILEALAGANCETVFYGIESGSDVILNRIEKRFTIEQAFSIVQETQALMKSDVSFIWGFPFETMEDFYDTIIALLAMQAMGAVPRFNPLVPLPSARLTDTFRSQITDVLARDIGWSGSLMENYEYGEELDSLIKQFPEIFAPFYIVETPEFDRKLKLLEQWGLGLGRQRTQSKPPGKSAPPPRLSLDGDSLLPGISEEVVFRRLGGKDFVLDGSDCLLYEPGPRSVVLLDACRRGATLDEVTQPLCLETGCSEEKARRFVLTTLEKFAERGFLTVSDVQ